MSKFVFQLPFKPMFWSMVRMLLPIGVIYIILLLVPILQLFSSILDYFNTLHLPENLILMTLIIVIVCFVLITLSFFLFGVPLIMTGIFQLLCPTTEIRPTGIRGSVQPGKTVKLLWNEILKVEEHRYAGLPYAKISSKNDPPIWVPLFYEDAHALSESVLTFCPLENPLYKYFLEKKLNAKQGKKAASKA